MHSQTCNQSTNVNGSQEKYKDCLGVNLSSISSEVMVVTDVDDRYETKPALDESSDDEPDNHLKEILLVLMGRDKFIRQTPTQTRMHNVQ